ncbi:MAG: hypothetical protein EOM72_11585 [Opitutae bacterium]|nr:hypothetical protein [Opitutae bacterium]
MEKSFPHGGKKRPNLPRNGKKIRDFSTQWKKGFHAVENFSGGGPAGYETSSCAAAMNPSSDGCGNRLALRPPF